MTTQKNDGGMGDWPDDYLNAEVKRCRKVIERCSQGCVISWMLWAGFVGAWTVAAFTDDVGSLTDILISGSIMLVSAVMIWISVRLVQKNWEGGISQVIPKIKG